MTDKSIAEQMREWIKAEKAHPRYSDIPYDAMCRYILQDLIQEWPYKVEALERELKATHIYLADEKRKLAEKDAKHIRIAKVNGQKNKRIFELKAELAEKDKEIEALNIDEAETAKDFYEAKIQLAEKDKRIEWLNNSIIAEQHRVDCMLDDKNRHIEKQSQRIAQLEAELSSSKQAEAEAVAECGRRDVRIKELEAMIAKFGEDVDRDLNGKDIESC